MDLSAVDRLVQEGIAEGVFPGAVYALSDGHKTELRSHGRYTYCPESEEVRIDTIWDLASVSKVVGTTTAAMLLYEKGSLNLDERVSNYLPEFAQNGKEKITVKNLLVHDSGLIAFRPYQRSYTSGDDVIKAIFDEQLEYPTGSKSIYSDLNMILLQQIIERLTDETLDRFLEKSVFQPLGMKDTGYNPGVGNPRCAPTEGVEEWRTDLRKLRSGLLKTEALENVLLHGPRHPDAAHWIQGEVHDPNAAVLNGVAGHAGLFSTAPDLVKFMAMMLNEGSPLLKPETVRLFTKSQSDQSSRALGWDTKSERGSSAGPMFGPRSYGHTGYTGTSVWLDPDSKVFAILLTNRVHPTSDNTKIIQFRPVFHEEAFKALSKN